MTDQSANVEGQGNQSEGNGKSSEVTLESLTKMVEELKGTNSRLLDESKKNKELAHSYKKEKEVLVNEKLESSTNLEEQLKIWKEKASKLETEKKDISKKALTESIFSRVVKYAPNAHNHKDLLNQSEYASILYDGIDEESLSISDDAVKLYVQTLNENKPYLFKQSQSVGTFNKKPPTENPTVGKNVNSMDKNEILEALKKLGGNSLI
jgi:vacuolar-type H+-ATPase subunit I/STV1